MNIKQKVRIKIKRKNKDIFSNFIGVNRLFVFVFSNQDNDAKARRYYLPKGIIKNYNVVLKRETFMTSRLILIQNVTKKKES